MINGRSWEAAREGQDCAEEDGCCNLLAEQW